MVWVTAGVSIGALIIAALALLLNLSERVSPLRSALYVKQLDIYEETLAAVNELHAIAITFIGNRGIRGLDPDARLELRSAASPAWGGLGQTMQRARILLPDAVVAALAEYNQVFAAVSAWPEIASNYPAELVQSSDPQLDLFEAYTALSKEIRRQLGVDHLNAETRALLPDKRQAPPSAW